MSRQLERFVVSMSEAYRKTATKIVSAIIIILVVAGAALLIIAQIFTGDTIRKGIYIEQTDVSWLSVQDAQNMVSKEISREYSAQSITLTYGNRTWDVKLKDIDFKFLVDNAVAHAYSIGRSGSIFVKIRSAIQLYLKEQQLNVEESIDREKLRAILVNIKKECDSTPKNAEISYSNGKISFKKESLFRNLDVDRNVELVENQLMKRNFDNITLMVEEKRPKIVYDEIKVIDTIISEYSTRFNPKDTNRTDNIKLACSRINNIIVLPGESFSMNAAVGPRTHENGYKEAPIIFKSELVPGTGGGVCQVSSTLYNTVLLAGLDVIEREHHSMPLSYISPGRDATITEDSIDFRFVNNLNYPISLHAVVTGNKLSISILGKQRDDGLTFKLRTETIGVYSPKPDMIILDTSLQVGQKEVERKSQKGLRVVLFREAYKNGTLQWRKKLTEDYYRPIQGKIRVSSDLYQLYQASQEMQ